MCMQMCVHVLPVSCFTQSQTGARQHWWNRSGRGGWRTPARSAWQQHRSSIRCSSRGCPAESYNAPEPAADKAFLSSARHSAWCKRRGQGLQAPQRWDITLPSMWFQHAALTAVVPCKMRPISLYCYLRCSRSGVAEGREGSPPGAAESRSCVLRSRPGTGTSKGASRPCALKIHHTRLMDIRDSCKSRDLWTVHPFLCRKLLLG